MKAVYVVKPNADWVSKNEILMILLSSTIAKFKFVYRFLSLLESSYLVKNRNSLSKLKMPSEFAAQHHVLPNYLNTLVKNHIEKTLREHIQDWMLYEVKSLLVKTDWGIGEICEGLSFSGQAAFTSFFTKKRKHFSVSIP